LLAAIVVEPGDEAGIDVPFRTARMIMRDRPDRARLAAEVLRYAESMA
jgi:hypothetical protein